MTRTGNPGKKAISASPVGVGWRQGHANEMPLIGTWTHHAWSVPGGPSFRFPFPSCSQLIKLGYRETNRASSIMNERMRPLDDYIISGFGDHCRSVAGMCEVARGVG
jgi:hypothetical protein